MSNRKNEPSLSALSFVLRHKELWPDGFEWNYRSCDHCAMGLAKIMWPQHVNTASTDSMAVAFGMGHIDAATIFTGMNAGIMNDITPEMIADKLDSLVA